MKVVAHPMVVAVALGFLAPTALAQAEDSVPPAREASVDADVALETALAVEPTAEQIAEIESEWLQVRDLVL